MKELKIKLTAQLTSKIFEVDIQKFIKHNGKKEYFDYVSYIESIKEDLIKEAAEDLLNGKGLIEFEIENDIQIEENLNVQNPLEDFELIY